MGSYKDLKSIMKDINAMEIGLKDFYDVAELAMKDNKSKDTIRLLRSKHTDNLKIINEIDIDEYGEDEWIKYVPEFNVKLVLPIGKIRRDSPPSEICKYILEYEEKIKGFYSSVSKKIIERDEKDLFDSLATFKDKQIWEIKQLVDYIEYM